MLAEKGCEVLLNMIQGKDIGLIDTIVPVVLVRTRVIKIKTSGINDQSFSKGQ